jgi:hypothetical protein
MMCAYHEEMLVQQQGDGLGRSCPVFLPVALEPFAHKSLVHSRLVLQQPGVHTHNYAREEVRGYLRTGPGSADCFAIRCTRGESQPQFSDQWRDRRWRWTGTKGLLRQPIRSETRPSCDGAQDHGQWRKGHCDFRRFL